MSELEKTWDSYSGVNTHKSVDWSTLPLVSEIPLDENSLVLDAGCGAGRYMGMFLQKTPQVFGFDISPAMVQAANKEGLSVCRGDLLHFPIASDTFDVVFSGIAINYVKQWPDTLREMHRVLKPGGRCLIVASNSLSLLAPLRKLMHALGLYRYGATYHTSLSALAKAGGKFGFVAGAGTIRNRVAPWSGNWSGKLYSLLTRCDRQLNRIFSRWGCEVVILFEKGSSQEKR